MLGDFIPALERLLEDNARKRRRDRLSAKRLWQLLADQGCEASYSAVCRYAADWRERHGSGISGAYVPLEFDPGEAYQFDWSLEYAVLGGATVRLRAAHMRLCYSRMGFLRAYPRESQEMVFDAHDRAFERFGGACVRGIYDSKADQQSIRGIDCPPNKTAVDVVFTGRERRFNRRFEQMCAHHLVQPEACTPRAAWEKGRVERQVGDLRGRLFRELPHFESLECLNGWLADRCAEHARTHPHPEIPDMTVEEVFEREERRCLIPWRGPFDGYQSRPGSVSKTCLVRFDANGYSVEARAAQRVVDIFAYADRVDFYLEGKKVGGHPRCFERGRTVYEPLHYLRVLERKPGALRNGAPFRNWTLPASIAEVRARLSGFADGDRQMVRILAAVQSDGMAEVEAACAEALASGAAGADLVLNLLSRRRDPGPAPEVAVPERLRLREEPKADCARYDRLRGTPDAAP